jgi:hypothetical protein
VHARPKPTSLIGLCATLRLTAVASPTNKDRTECNNLFDRFVCYTEVDRCGDSYLKLGLSITICLIGLCATLRLTAVASPTSRWTEYNNLFDRFVCYTEADRCGESYLKMD